MLKITEINGVPTGICIDENGEICKNSYECKADETLMCGVGALNEDECNSLKHTSTSRYRQLMFDKFDSRR